MTRFKDYAQDLVCASDLRPSTARTYESALRVHIYPFFGDHDVEDVTPTVGSTWTILSPPPCFNLNGATMPTPQSGDCVE